MATVSYEIPEKPFFMQVKPGDTDPIMYSASDFRRYTAALSRRPGVLSGPSFVVSQTATVGFSVHINSGYAHIGAGTDFDYIVHLGTPKDMTLTGFNPAPTTERNHSVYIAIYDALFSGTGYNASLVITEDTTGVGAPAPSGARTSLLLATITVKPGQALIQNENISNVAKHGGASDDWTDLSPYLSTSFKVATDLLGVTTFEAQYHEGQVRMGGAIQRNSGNFAGGTVYIIGFMPLNLRPKQVRYVTCPCSRNMPDTVADTGGYTVRLQIDPGDGQMHLRTPTGQTPSWVGFDGVTYDIDYDK